MRKPPAQRPLVPKVARKALDARAEAYVDSPFMNHRLRRGRKLIVGISGRYGVYETVVDLDRPRQDSCSCPSDEFPCKHVRAVRETWRRYPETFFDLGGFLERLKSRTKTELLEAIGAMAERSPPALGALGVSEFADREETDEYEIPELE